MRPIDLPPAEHFEHGTRSRYVCGCRCDPCRVANNKAKRDRTRFVREAAAEVKPNGPPLAGRITRTRRDGSKYQVAVKNCPGCDGLPCVRGGAWLRTGGPVCTECIDRATVWNGLVPAARARAHLRKLSRKGVGYKAVAAACDVATSGLSAVLSGAAPWIRAQTERRILAVDAGARADAALVPSGPTLKRIRRLMDREGFTRSELARRIFGQQGPHPALQLLYGNRKCVLASTEAKVERFCRLLEAEGEDMPSIELDEQTADVLGMTREGRSAREIAEALEISTRTVTRLRTKHGVTNPVGIESGAA